MKNVVAYLACLVVVVLPVSAQPPCGPAETNVLPNCAFDADTNGWNVRFGFGTWDGTVGAANPGSMLIDSDFDKGENSLEVESDCFDASSLADQDVGYGMKFMSSNGSSECRAILRTYGAANCMGSFVTHFGDFEVSTSPGFVLALGEDSVASGTLSGTLGFECTDFEVPGRGGGFAVFADDGFAGPGLLPVQLQFFSIE